MILFRPISSILRKRITKWHIVTRIVPVGHAHSQTCPASRSGAAAGSGAATDAGSSGGSGSGALAFKRAEKSGKCRLIWFPEEWFTFFHVKTGVSGFYVLLFGLANYCISKEILVMEHEYYGGLSWIVVLWVVVKKFGPGLAAHLDKEVDEYTESLYVGRKQEIAMYESLIKNAQFAQIQAQGQKMLMDAKKENILMQLEAVYRERAMHVYKTVKGRMDYHLKLHQAEGRIHQKWMIGWILQSVMKSITPEFEANALTTAIKEIEEVASRA